MLPEAGARLCIMSAGGRNSHRVSEEACHEGAAIKSDILC